MAKRHRIEQLKNVDISGSELMSLLVMEQIKKIKESSRRKVPKLHKRKIKKPCNTVNKAVLKCLRKPDENTTEITKNRCSFCGHEFQRGELKRLIDVNGTGMAKGNPFTCRTCDIKDKIHDKDDSKMIRKWLEKCKEGA